MSHFILLLTGAAFGFAGPRMNPVGSVENTSMPSPDYPFPEFFF